MPVERRQPETQAPTSSRQTRKLVGTFDRYLKQSGGLLVDRFGKETAPVMRGEMLDEYRRLIPEAPYIGGKRDLYSGSIPLAQWTLAANRVMIRHSGTVEDTGELLHRMFRAQMERVPQVIRHGMGRFRFTKLRQWQIERAARWSQALRYPGGFVFERIEGDGKTFDFGIDITECGVVKYLHAEGADELGPYICDIDYVGAEAMGIGLQRTKTLAWGCDRCDFRLSKHGTTAAPWPPEFIEQTCGQPRA